MSFIEIKIERVAMTPLETAESWVRTNPLVAAVIAGLVIVIVYMSFFSGPKNYQDCVIQVSTEAKTERGASIGKRACGKKFPQPAFIPRNPNPFLNLE
jgi:hypothetical protein